MKGRLFSKMDKTALPFLILGVFVICESAKMPMGSFNDPDTGLFPLLLGIILLISSLISLLVSNLRGIRELSPAASLRNVIYAVGSLILFRFCLPVFGYSLTTFLTLVFLIKMVGLQRWGKTIAYSLLFTGACYLLFVEGLGIQFPRGIFRY